jgi:hypothetical protein
MSGRRGKIFPVRGIVNTLTLTLSLKGEGIRSALHPEGWCGRERGRPEGLQLRVSQRAVIEKDVAAGL